MESKSPTSVIPAKSLPPSSRGREPIPCKVHSHSLRGSPSRHPSKLGGGSWWSVWGSRDYPDSTLVGFDGLLHGRDCHLDLVVVRLARRQALEGNVGHRD